MFMLLVSHVYLVSLDVVKTLYHSKMIKNCSTVFTSQTIKSLQIIWIHYICIVLHFKMYDFGILATKQTLTVYGSWSYILTKKERRIKTKETKMRTWLFGSKIDSNEVLHRK